MAQYINKSALVAELEKRLSKNKRNKLNLAAAFEDNYLLLFINTLEVKEVDLETNIQDYINSHFTEGRDGVMNSDWYKVLGGVHCKDLKEIAEHFFELGMAVSNKAQKRK